MAVNRGAGTFQPTMARPLFSGSYLMFEGAEGTEVALVNLVSGWFAELERLSGTESR